MDKTVESQDEQPNPSLVQPEDSQPKSKIILIVLGILVLIIIGMGGLFL